MSNEEVLKVVIAAVQEARQDADRKAREECAEIAARYRTNSGAAIAAAIRSTISEVKP